MTITTQLLLLMKIFWLSKLPKLAINWENEMFLFYNLSDSGKKCLDVVFVYWEKNLMTSGNAIQQKNFWR